MIRSTSTTTTHSTVHSHSTEIIPILFTVLPASLRRRIAPGVYSLHRSIRLNWLSRGGGGGGDSGSGSATKASKVDLHGGGSGGGGTPACASTEPQIRGYYDANTAAAAAMPAESMTGGNGGQELLSGSSFFSGSLLETQTSASTPPEGDGSLDFGPRGGAVPKYEVESGLRWNRVIPALNLLRNALYEAQQPRSDSHLVRSLYINALLYLLEALPEDLTCEEYTFIQKRLPEKARSSTLSASAAASKTMRDPRDRYRYSRSTSPKGPAEPSYLHRILATSIIHCFLVLQFLLPYVKLLLQHIYQYERTHRITERVATVTLDTANSLGKGGINIGSAVLSLSEGRVGAAISSFAAWWIEGVTGGICEGIGEGMVILGVVRPEAAAGLEKGSI